MLLVTAFSPELLLSFEVPRSRLRIRSSLARVLQIRRTSDSGH
jgi:uncharacterized protein YbbK (DUF523 family)